jgi:maltooligosyltrehalose trehalohydrolase
MWNDDFHHSARVAATGRREAYYSDYLGAPQELVSALKRGYLFQGQRSGWQKKPRGTWAATLAPEQFVVYLDNHDQVANAATGARFHQITSPGRHRALTALMLLSPGTPLLFQGQEFCAGAPFLFFADHGGDLGEAVRKGRAEFMAQFPSVGSPEGRARLDRPDDPATFAACVLDWSERDRNRAALELHRDLLRLRRPASTFDGAVLGPSAFVVRFFSSGDDRLLVVNLGVELRLVHAAEPLLAPPPGRRWKTRWSSEAPRYGGEGTPVIDDEERGWLVPGECAVVLEVA